MILDEKYIARDGDNWQFGRNVTLPPISREAGGAMSELRSIFYTTEPAIIAVSTSQEHTFSKQNKDSITLMAGLGVQGDAHMGEKVKHRSRVRRDPNQPNLRQVHLIHSELLDALQGQGFAVSCGTMGENITTRGLNLLDLPTGTRLHLGAAAIVEVTGLRNPCVQLNQFQPGLMAAVLDRDEEGKLVRKAGIMGVVLTGGEICAGDTIQVELPPQPYRRLEPV